MHTVQELPRLASQKTAAGTHQSPSGAVDLDILTVRQFLTDPQIVGNELQVLLVLNVMTYPKYRGGSVQNNRVPVLNQGRRFLGSQLLSRGIGNIP